MNDHINRPVVETTAPVIGRRVSWGAVFAGLIVALVTQLTLNILGLGLGAGMLDFQDADAEKGVGIGAAIWLIATTVIALFVGGWVAGRLAGVARNQDSWLHGILTWSCYTLVAFFLLTSAVGGLLSGIGGVLGRTLSEAGQSVAEVAPRAMGAPGGALEQVTGGEAGGVDWGAIKEDARQLTAALGQENQEQRQKDLQEMQSAMARLFDRSGEPNPQDREALVNAVARYTGKSQEEAEQQVARWEQMYQEAREKGSEIKEKTEQKAREVADATARGVSKGALWAFGILVLGAVAAGLGGVAGRPRTVIVETTRNP